MAKKEFKAESKRLMDLMINSIYTNKDIFLREIISNASDAIDKLHYMSLTDKSISVNKKDFNIIIKVDEENRTLTISDNGIGMSKEDLENNLGTIAKSGSLLFKEENKPKKDIDIIGQFGVGFYSSFMVSDKVTVISKAYGSTDAYKWESSGLDGYEISKATKDNYGTDIIISIKNDDEDNKYSEYLHAHKIKDLIKKYSDYITVPIKLEEENDGKKELNTINDMVPLWKRNKNKIKDEDYNTFYSDKFFDYEKPLLKIHTSAEGLVSYNSLLFIPSHTPYDFYTKTYEKGLQLYSNGVLIMEKCKELLPDYYSFVKGVVDSPDLSLNISREILQTDKNLLTIAKSIETKITKELLDLQESNREDYLVFFSSFGPQIKFGIYDNFGMNKDKLKDLLIFDTSEGKKETLKEFVKSLKKDEKIYYVCGETVDKINSLPQVENYKDKKIKLLYCLDYMDEFVIKTLMEYEEHKFINIASSESDISTDEEKEEIKKLNEDNKDMFKFMQEHIEGVKEVRFTNHLKNHPVCLTSVGEVSIEMEKVINAMPTDENIKAEKVLEINSNHKIKDKLETLYKKDKDTLKKYTKVLYAQARMIEGLPIDNPSEITSLICDILS